MKTKLTNQQETSQVFRHRGLGEVGLEGATVLVGLGLSERQARVYLALLKAGWGRARVVSGLTAISRQDIYRLFGELQQLGLVRQNLTVPVSYTPAPITETARLLLERKTEELTNLTAKANQLTKKLTQAQPPLAPAAPKTCFGEVFKGERGKQYQTAIEQAQISIEVVSGWVRFRQFCFRFEAPLRVALKRNVALRFVAEKPPSHKLPRWIKPTLPKYKFQLKTLSNTPDVAIAIFDGTQAAIASNAAIRITQGIDLWTTPPALITACQAYFNRTWANASKQP
jgi:sugar-specific transcriptional regulator TrmB